MTVKKSSRSQFSKRKLDYIFTSLLLYAHVSKLVYLFNCAPLHIRKKVIKLPWAQIEAFLAKRTPFRPLSSSVRNR